jgi:hypothetical protein
MNVRSANGKYVRVSSLEAAGEKQREYKNILLLGLVKVAFVLYRETFGIVHELSAADTDIL